MKKSSILNIFLQHFSFIIDFIYLQRASKTFSEIQPNQKVFPPPAHHNPLLLWRYLLNTVSDGPAPLILTHLST